MALVRYRLSACRRRGGDVIAERPVDGVAEHVCLQCGDRNGGRAVAPPPARQPGTRAPRFTPRRIA